MKQPHHLFSDIEDKESPALAAARPGFSERVGRVAGYIILALVALIFFGSLIWLVQTVWSAVLH